MSRRISVTDTAKLIRKELKKHYPTIKFRVRSSKYSMGASIDVSWTDGPAMQAVVPIVKPFAGASFDGMIDLKSYHDSELNGELVHFGADYVFTQRSISNEGEKTKLAEELIRCTCQTEQDKFGNEIFGNEHISDLARRILWRQDYSVGMNLQESLNSLFNRA